MPNDTPLLKAALAILQKAGGKLNIVVLNKALFYLDLYALLEFGHTVTGIPYVALPYGPVVKDYPKRLVKALEEAGLAHQEPDGLNKPMVADSCLPVDLAPEVNPLVDHVVAHIGQFTSSEAVDYAHQNPGWRMAREQTKPPRPAEEINMMLALQQLAAEDPWLSAPLTPDEAHALHQAASGPTYPWD
jgi:hypothetical protein